MCEKDHLLIFTNTVSFWESPSILHDKLPALEENCVGETIWRNLNVMQSARKIFIEAESSEKWRRELRSKTRTRTGKIFSVGESVYYKRQNCGNVWKGPGKTIGVDGEVIKIRHDGQGVCVHSSMLKMENSEFTNEQVQEENKEMDAPVDTVCHDNSDKDGVSSRKSLRFTSADTS